MCGAFLSWHTTVYAHECGWTRGCDCAWKKIGPVQGVGTDVVQREADVLEIHFCIEPTLVGGLHLRINNREEWRMISQFLAWAPGQRWLWEKSRVLIWMFCFKCLRCDLDPRLQISSRIWICMSGAQRFGLGCRIEFWTHSLRTVFVAVALHELTWRGHKEKNGRGLRTRLLHK